MAIQDYTPQIKRANAESAMAALEASRREGSDLPALPSHVLMANGEYIGYWAMNTVPFVLAWHRKDMNVRQTIAAFNAVDAIMSDRGTPVYMVPLAEDSPYCPLMEKLGFSEVGSAKIYIKEK